MAKTACKIRKRGFSSSSSSSLIRQYRFKRAVLVGKRAGSTTPVPTWITAPTMSSSLAMTNAENIVTQTTKEASVSARKLAATLWESNAIPSPQAKQVLKKKVKRRKAPIVAKMAHSLPQNLSDPSYSTVSEKMDAGRASIVSQKLQVNDYKLESLGPAANGGFMERMDELFDLICGTSTGGVFAAALGMRLMSADQLEDIYKNMGKVVFSEPVPKN